MEEYLEGSGEEIDDEVEGKKTTEKDDEEEGELPEELMRNKSSMHSTKSSFVSLDSSFLSPTNTDSFQFLLPN